MEIIFKQPEQTADTYDRLKNPSVLAVFGESLAFFVKKINRIDEWKTFILTWKDEDVDRSIVSCGSSKISGSQGLTVT